MVDQETFDYLLPLAYEWAKTKEEFVLAHGHRLGARHAHDANLVGVRDCARVRVLVVDRIPLPENPELAEASKRIGIITEDTRCAGFGHALIIRVDAWNDRELILHNLVHIAQCERSGGLEQWVREYLADRTTVRISPLAHSKKKRVALRAKSAPPRLRRDRHQAAFFFVFFSTIIPGNCTTSATAAPFPFWPRVDS